MLVQEPVHVSILQHVVNTMTEHFYIEFRFQAAVWHCLNHYAYADATFLAERLFTEGKR